MPSSLLGHISSLPGIISSSYHHPHSSIICFARASWAFLVSQAPGHGEPPSRFLFAPPSTANLSFDVPSFSSQDLIHLSLQSTSPEAQFLINPHPKEFISRIMLGLGTLLIGKVDFTGVFMELAVQLVLYTFIQILTEISVCCLYLVNTSSLFPFSLTY